jgi:alpha-beta hydrolase superfamily lysophospholipase
MQHTTGEFTGLGNVKLFYQTWLPEAAGQPPRAVLAMAHGMGEHSGRYQKLAAGLASQGVGACAFDHRGHGRSAGRRGHVDTFGDYIHDARAFVQLVRQHYPAVPVFLYGHSMGSLVAISYLAECGADGLAGAVLSGTPVTPDTSGKGAQVVLARLIASVLPRLAVGVPSEPEKLSRDPADNAAHRADPLLLRAFTARWGVEFLAAPARVRGLAGAITLPVLFLHGGADPLALLPGAQAFYEQVPAPDKRLIVYPGARHEPHNDLCAPQVAQDMAAWLLSHLPA